VREARDGAAARGSLDGHDSPGGVGGNTNTGHTVQEEAGHSAHTAQDDADTHKHSADTEARDRTGDVDAADIDAALDNPDAPARGSAPRAASTTVVRTEMAPVRRDRPYSNGADNCCDARHGELYRFPAIVAPRGAEGERASTASEGIVQQAQVVRVPARWAHRHTHVHRDTAFVILHVPVACASRFSTSGRAGWD
jgi:hypothetical protein